MKKRWIVLSIILLLILGVSAALAATNDDFELSWFTIDGGGGTSSGGNFSLSGTSGQPDAGSMSNGGFSLKGGFWVPRIEPTIEPTPIPGSHDIYLPLTIK